MRAPPTLIRILMKAWLLVFLQRRAVADETSDRSSSANFLLPKAWQGQSPNENAVPPRNPLEENWKKREGGFSAHCAFPHNCANSDPVAAAQVRQWAADVLGWSDAAYAARTLDAARAPGGAPLKPAEGPAPGPPATMMINGQATTNKLGHEEIKTLYKALVKKAHPDKGGQKQAFQSLQTAKDVLERAVTQFGPLDAASYRDVIDDDHIQGGDRNGLSSSTTRGEPLLSTTSRRGTSLFPSSSSSFIATNYKYSTNAGGSAGGANDVGSSTTQRVRSRSEGAPSAPTKESAEGPPFRTGARTDDWVTLGKAVRARTAWNPNFPGAPSSGSPFFPPSGSPPQVRPIPPYPNGVPNFGMPNFEIPNNCRSSSAASGGDGFGAAGGFGGPYPAAFGPGPSAGAPRSYRPHNYYDDYFLDANDRVAPFFPSSEPQKFSQERAYPFFVQHHEFPTSMQTTAPRVLTQTLQESAFLINKTLGLLGRPLSLLARGAGAGARMISSLSTRAASLIFAHSSAICRAAVGGAAATAGAALEKTLEHSAKHGALLARAAKREIGAAAEKARETISGAARAAAEQAAEAGPKIGAAAASKANSMKTRVINIINKESLAGCQTQVAAGLRSLLESGTLERPTQPPLRAVGRALEALEVGWSALADDRNKAAWRETVDSVGRLAESLYSFPARSKGTAPAADQEQGLYSGNEGSAPESIVI